MLICAVFGRGKSRRCRRAILMAVGCCAKTTPATRAMKIDRRLLFFCAAASAFTPRLPAKVIRHTRLPVWPAWQGVPLLILSQLPGPCRSIADKLEDAFGGRVCPMQFNPQEADPFVLLVHHRHAFRPFDFLRPIFSKVIMPEGFPAHPHRGFETVTYVLPGRAGLTHRDSEGCKMRYGDGAVQWMTAGRGMLHEEMWDTDYAVDAELYQLWVNLPPGSKMVPPRVQLIEPVSGSGKAAEVIREGSTSVRRAPIVEEVTQGGRVNVKFLCAAGEDRGAETYTPMTIAHVELNGEGASHTMPLPEGWTCIVYVRRGQVSFGGGEGAKQYETAYLSRSGGDGLALTSMANGLTDVLVLAGQPIGAPVVASGTMVMNDQFEVNRALADYQRGAFGIPWDHTLDDAEWAKQCDQFVERMRV